MCLSFDTSPMQLLYNPKMVFLNCSFSIGFRIYILQKADSHNLLYYTDSVFA